MGLGSVVEEEVAKTVMGVSGASVTRPTALWLTFCEEEPKRTQESKTLAGELTYAGFERYKLNLAEYEYVAGTESEPGYWTNKAEIKLPKNTNVTGKDIAKYFAVVDVEKSSESGKLRAYGPLEAEREIVKTLSEAASIPAKSLKIRFE